MPEFSQYFKIKVVQDYLTSSQGLRLIARKYGIKSNTTVLKWVKQYEKYGINGLEIRSPNMVYDGSFKLNVLNWMKTNNASLLETALNFNISEPSTIWQWQRTLEIEGRDALFRTRGRSIIMSADKQARKDNTQTELERVKEENELLKIEVEYLKKLRALVQSQQDNERK